MRCGFAFRSADFRLSFGLFVSLSLISWQSFAGEYFDNLRVDHQVPAKCQIVQTQDFQNNSQIQIIYFGIKGAVEKGFTDEYPVTRDEVSMLWDIFREGDHSQAYQDQLNANIQLREAYQAIKANYEEMGFDFHAEGDILEILALTKLKSRYPANKYFITGGLGYHDIKNTRRIGELDLIVAEVDTCKVILVGEAKEGMNQLGHAHQQMQRFTGFLRAIFGSKKAL